MTCDAWCLWTRARAWKNKAVVFPGAEGARRGGISEGEASPASASVFGSPSEEKPKSSDEPSDRDS